MPDQTSRSLANFLFLILVLDSPIQIFLSPLPTPLVLGSHLPPTWFAFFGSDITGSLLCHLFFSFFLFVLLSLFFSSVPATLKPPCDWDSPPVVPAPLSRLPDGCDPRKRPKVPPMFIVIAVV